MKAFLLSISPILIVGMFAFRALNKGASEESGILYGYPRAVSTCYFLWGLFAIALAYLNWDILSVTYLKSSDKANLIGIFVVLCAFQTCRYWLESSERIGQGWAPFRNIVIDFFHNWLIFSAAYLSTFSISSIFSVAGIIVAILTVALQLKFRIIDDILKYRIYSASSVRYTSTNSNDPGHIVLRGLLDHIPRSWLYSAFSFSIVYLHMSITEKPPADFIISHPSDNQFADIFYFNIVTMATVGYGDIVPISATAKILTILEILISIFILSSILQLVWGRFQKESEKSDNRNG